MAVTFVDSTTTGNTAISASRAIPVPVGAAVDDVVVVRLSRWESFNAAVTTPSGFITRAQVLTSGGIGHLDTFIKRLTAADSGTYTFSWTGAMWVTGQAILYRGVDPAANLATVQLTSATNTNTSMPSVTLNGVGTGSALDWHGYSESGGTHTPPTGWTETEDNDSDVNAYQAGVASGNYTASGGTSSVSSNNISSLLELPAAAAGGNVTGIAATDITMSLTVVGQKLVPATAAMSVNVTAVVNGINDRVGTAASNFTTSAVIAGVTTGVTVNGIAASNFTFSGVVSGERTATGVLTPGIGIDATITGLHSAFGLAATSITFTATASEFGFMNMWDGRGLQYHMNRKAGTLVGDTPTKDAQLAANIWAGTTGKELVEALNIRAGNVLPAYKELAGVLNQLAGTTGLEVDGAAAMIP